MLPALRTCNGKVVYDKRGALTAKNRRWNEGHVKLRIYECPNNNHWHLTSSDPDRDERNLEIDKKHDKPNRKKRTRNISN